jgi:multiple sugar transport system substrate-binding protein/putative aldouronate transport system substrate-binding protein
MGILDPDSATQTWEGGMVPKMNSKRIFLLWYSWQNGFWNTPARNASGENFMYAPVDDFRWYQPGDTYYGSGRVFAVGTEGGKELAPAKKERVLALLDWLVGPECLTFQHDGLPNVSYTVNADGTYTQTDWGASALMDNLPTPAEWGGAGYNDGLSKINQWMMSSQATDPATKEPYRPEFWASYLAVGNASKTSAEWIAKYGYQDEVKYMIDKGQMSVIPNVNMILPTDSNDISLIRSQCGTQVTDASWKMIFASSDAEFASMLSSLKSDLAGLGWDQLVSSDKSKAQLIVDARNAAK